MLARPLSRRITKSSDPNAPWQPAFNSRLHKIGRQESQRYCHIDLTQAAVLSPSDALDSDVCVLDKLLEPVAPARDRDDQGCASLGADRTSVSGFNCIRDEDVPSSFRRWLLPRDVKGEVTLCAAFAALRLDELDDHLTRKDLDARYVGLDNVSIINRGRQLEALTDRTEDDRLDLGRGHSAIDPARSDWPWSRTDDR